MPIPDYQSLMLSVLQFAAQGEVKLGDVVKFLAQKLALGGGFKNGEVVCLVIPEGII